MICSADWVRRLPSRGPALGSGHMPFTCVIGVVRPVDVEATASGSLAASSFRIGYLLQHGPILEEAQMSLGAVTGCGTLLVGFASSRSVINDGANSASLNTAGLNGHSPQ